MSDKKLRPDRGILRRGDLRNSAAGLHIRLSGHICAFFNSSDDAYRVLLPFVREGLECGEKAVHTVDPRRREEHMQRLASAGVDVEAVQKSDQLD